MFTPDPMEFVCVITRKEKSDDFARRLMEIGILHPADARGVLPGLEQLSAYSPDREDVLWETAGKRLDGVLKKLDIEDVELMPAESVTAGHALDTVREIEDLLEPLFAEKAKLAEQAKQIEMLLNKTMQYPTIPAIAPGPRTSIEIAFGAVTPDGFTRLQDSLAGIPHILEPARREKDTLICIVIVLKKDNEVLKKALEGAGWKALDISKEIPSEPEEKLRQQLSQNQKDGAKIDREIQEIKMQFGPEIRQIASAVRIKRILAEAKRLASTTASTVVFAGWVPSSSRNVIFQEAKKVDKLSYISGRKPEETAVKAEDIPVRLSHNPLLKPFQILTETYGIPAYGTIDPTVFVAITFLAMFGAMFGDVGDGLALCIPAIFLLKRRVEFLRKTAALLLYAGLSSIVFGFLYGSFFGVEFRALWLKPMEDTEHLFRAFIIFGMAVLTFGVALNVINALRHRRWRDAFLDKAGLFSGVAYWAGIGIAVRFLSQKPLSPALIAVFAATLFAIFIVPVVEATIRKKGALIAATEHGIDIFEILLGYLANTVSFIRIAAFALNHASFFFVIFQISGMLKNSAGGVLSAMTLIFGNILIILLEGMVVMIQSLRLNYYEFFSRFVTTGKIKYQPLGIKTAGQMK